jgi:hypothetical protein
MTTQLYYKDSAGAMNQTIPNGDPLNAGLYKRHAFTKNSKTCELSGPIYCDICQQDKLLLNGLQVSLKMYPTTSAFHLTSAENNYKVSITDAILQVCAVKLSPGALLGIAEGIKHSPATYPYSKSNIKTFSVPAGQASITIDDVLNGQIPNQMIVGLVSSAAFSGDISKSPFNFKHYSCNFVAFYVDGHSTPARPLQPNFEEGTYNDAYLTLFRGTGKYMANMASDIKRNDYPKGYCLYILDISNSHTDEYLTIQKKGHTRLELKFSTPLPETATIIMYAKFPGLMKVDESRNVIVT